METLRAKVLAALAIWLTSISMLPGAQTAAPARLVEIKVFGSQRYSEAEIIRATELELGAKVTPSTFQDAANRLAATAAFSDVSYKYSSLPGGAAVEFHVADGSDFGACQFNNLIWFSEKELRVRLKQMIPLFADTIPLKGDIPAKIEVALEYLLKEKGIPGTVTILGAGSLGGKVSAVQFSVAGVRLVVQQVEIQGAQAVDAAALAGAIQPLLNVEYDQTFTREFVMRNVGPLYWRLGYLKVAFGPPNVGVLSGTSQDVEVIVSVSEGERYSLREIGWEGNEAIPSAELAKLVDVLPGHPADTVQLEKDLEEIEGLYEQKGYLGARAKLRPSFDDAAQTVAFEIRIVEGDLYSMGQLEIAGIDAERAEALRKTSELAPGQPYNRAYWTTFISKSSRLLPASRTPWKATPEERVHADTKTVDVTLTFAPDTGK